MFRPTSVLVPFLLLRCLPTNFCACLWCVLLAQNCNSGDRLEIKKCSKKWTQRFEWDGGRLKVASKNMCLTNSGGLRLRSCGGGGQNFRGYRSSGGFQLKPSSNSKCLSQHHVRNPFVFDLFPERLSELYCGLLLPFLLCTDTIFSLSLYSSSSSSSVSFKCVSFSNNPIQHAAPQVRRDH